MHRFPYPLGGIALLLALALPVLGETVYKSVGKDGRVTYSDKPPADAVQSAPVALPPPPSEQDRQMVEERMQAAKALADELTQEREQKEKVRREQAEAAARAAAQAPAVVDLGQGEQEEAPSYGWTTGFIYPPGYWDWLYRDHGRRHPHHYPSYRPGYSHGRPGQGLVTPPGLPTESYRSRSWTGESWYRRD